MLSSAPTRRALLQRVLLHLFSILAITIAISIDLFWLRLPLLAEYAPSFTPLYLVRTGLVCLGTGCFVASITPAVPSINWPQLWDSWGRVACSTGGSTGFLRRAPRITVVAVLGVEFLSLGLAGLFLWNPSLFSWLTQEWHPVEVLSAALLFINSGLFVRTAVRLHTRKKETGVLSVWIAGAFALLFFLVAMEEVSWFQQPLGLLTPSGFENNSQGELNLHNFVTSKAENAYYFATFFLLVLGPFLIHETGSFHGQRVIDRVICRFTPSRALVAVAAPMAAFNYDMWNVLLTQLMFFLALWILLYYLLASWECPPGWQIFASLLALVVLCQAVFLLNGHRFLRMWDITEYKELLIPLACCFYACEVWRQVSRPHQRHDSNEKLALNMPSGEAELTYYPERDPDYNRLTSKGSGVRES